MSAGAGPLPPEAFHALLQARARTLGLSFSPEVTGALARYLAELDLWRRRTNLTGRLTAPDLVSHTLESAFGERLIPHGVEVVDIGSGAGFPGVPLAIVRPDIRVTPLEVRHKRAEFLRHLEKAVPIENSLVFEGRPSDLAEGFCRVATSRAVGGIGAVLGEARFLKPGGAFLAWTTDADALWRSLSPVFELERVEPVPETRRKVIALFRRRT